MALFTTPRPATKCEAWRQRVDGGVGEVEALVAAGKDEVLYGGRVNGPVNDVASKGEGWGRLGLRAEGWVKSNPGPQNRRSRGWAFPSPRSPHRPPGGS